MLRDRRRCLDHGHRAALLPLLIAVVDRRLIPSGATNDTNSRTTLYQPYETTTGEINIYDSAAALAANSCCEEHQFMNTAY